MCKINVYADLVNVPTDACFIAPSLLLHNVLPHPRKGRFVGENQRPDAPEGGEGDVGDDDVPNATKPAASGKLVCRIPEETLFQLQQIYEALEGASGVKPASNSASFTDLTAVSGGDGGEAETMSGGNESSVVTPEKTTKVSARF